MKIAFLLNHYDRHQIPHIVPYALELARLYPDVAVTVLSSSAQQTRYARKLAASWAVDRCHWEALPLSLPVRILDPLLSQWFFLRKRAALRYNAARLAQFDAIVTPEMTALALRRLPGLDGVRLVFTGHGAGDNPEFGSLDARIGEFDFCLLPGKKYAEALTSNGYLKPSQYAITGYPKFEAIRAMAPQTPRLFNNGRPTVVYNPHHRVADSSWRTMGTALLDYFYASDRYNLIFAPHVVLFKRAWGRGSRLPRRYRSTEHVLIDTGSERSIDMTYMEAADIYIGDVSSQVYEFLQTPRPCIFLDARVDNTVPREQMLAWTLGPVLTRIDALHAALDKACAAPQAYRAQQEDAFNYTFSLADEAASTRGAHAIVEYLGGCT